MKEKIKNLIAELDKAVMDCKSRQGYPLASDYSKSYYKGAGTAYENVIISLKREFKI